MDVSLAYWIYLAAMLLALAAAFRWHGRPLLGTSLMVLTLVLAMFAPVMGSIL